MAPHDTLDDDARSQAALHALGCLDSGESAAYEAHLAECPSCRAEVASLRPVVSALTLAAPTVPPPAGMKERLLASLRGARRPAHLSVAPSPEDHASQAPAQSWKAWTGTARDKHIFVPGADGLWEQTAFAGVEARRLFVDPSNDRVTMLIRMAAGSSYPAHVHAGPEECYVLEGDLRVGPSLHMRAGDYQRVEQGQAHPVQSTDNGCLLFLVSSLSDELLTTHG